MTIYALKLSNYFLDKVRDLVSLIFFFQVHEVRLTIESDTPKAFLEKMIGHNRRYILVLTAAVVCSVCIFAVHAFDYQKFDGGFYVTHPDTVEELYRFMIFPRVGNMMVEIYVSFFVILSNMLFFLRKRRSDEETLEGDTSISRSKNCCPMDQLRSLKEKLIFAFLVRVYHD